MRSGPQAAAPSAARYAGRLRSAFLMQEPTLRVKAMAERSAPPCLGHNLCSTISGAKRRPPGGSCLGAAPSSGAGGGSSGISLHDGHYMLVQHWRDSGTALALHCYTGTTLVLYTRTALVLRQCCTSLAVVLGQDSTSATLILPWCCNGATLVLNRNHTAPGLRWRCAGTRLVLRWHCTGTVLVL